MDNDISQAYLKSLEEKAQMATELEYTKAELKDAVNFLCIKCGEYNREHLGYCDGCKWHNYKN